MKVKPLKPWVSPIPKLVHLIWIGNQDYPDYFKLFLKSFHKYLPEFTIKVWGNKDLTRKNFPKTFTYIQKAKKVHGKQMYDEDGEIFTSKRSYNTFVNCIHEGVMYSAGYSHEHVNENAPPGSPQGSPQGPWRAPQN